MRIALALEYPLMQEGGTEVLVQELLRGLGPGYEIVLVSDDRQAEDLPEEFARLIRRHLSWNPRTASRESAEALALAMRNEKLQLAHFHFGGNFAWSNRFP